MRKLVLALLFCLVATVAADSQSCPTACPTRPAGDSTNAPATTAFVTGAINSVLTPGKFDPTGLQFSNDGTATGVYLHSVQGTSIPLWCAATSSYKNFVMQQPVAISGATDNGSGLILLTVTTTANFNTVDYYRVENVGGVTNANGKWRFVVNDAFHVTLVGSTFAGTYTAGTGQISGDIISVVTDTYIDGVAGAAIRGLTTPITVSGAVNNGAGLIRLTVSSTAAFFANGAYFVSDVGGVTNANGVFKVTIIDGTHLDLQGSTFAGVYTSGGSIFSVRHDAFLAYNTGCVTAHIDWSAVQGARTNPVIGYPAIGGSALEPLVGACIMVAGTIQGGAAEELCISRYNQGQSNFTSTVTGNTGGVTGSWVKLTGVVHFITWAEQMPQVDILCGVRGSAGLNNIQIGLGFYFADTVPNAGDTRQWFDASGNVNVDLKAILPFNAGASNRLFSIQPFLQTEAGTVTAGAVKGCTLRVHSIF